LNVKNKLDHIIKDETDFYDKVFEYRRKSIKHFYKDSCKIEQITFWLYVYMGIHGFLCWKAVNNKQNKKKKKKGFILLAAKRALQIHKHLHSSKLTCQMSVDLICFIRKYVSQEIADFW
jgi:hypothetical protein